MCVVRGAEQALKESEAKFRTMTNVIPQMVWATQPGEETDYFNDRILEFTGQPKKALTGPGWANHIHPDVLPKAYSKWQNASATGTSLESEHRVRHQSGEYRWVLGHALPLQREDGTSHWMGTFTDIQDQKTAAEQLQLANERKDAFLAILAHELRNPWAPVADLVDSDTMFQLASVSKPVSSTVMASVAGQGLIGWDDPLRKHDGSFKLSDAKATRLLTLRDLFCHRSRLAGHAGDLLEGMGYTCEEILFRLRYLPINGCFRKQYNYTNFSLSETAFAAARSTGTSWKDLAEKRLVRPAGMRTASYRHAD